jgi:hypothetical protein
MEDGPGEADFLDDAVKVAESAAPAALDPI